MSTLEYTPIDKIPGIVAEARKTFDSGVTRPLSWRLAQLEGFRRMFTEDREAMVDCMVKDLGRPVFEGTMECIDALSQADYLIANLKELMRPQKKSGPMLMFTCSFEIVKEPMGVVLNIAPWNFPIGLSLIPVMGAIAAGCTVILKPSEVSPNAARVLDMLLTKYIDNSAVKVVQGAVKETQLLLEQRFDKIFYTGSGMVAKSVMAAAAKNLTPVTLELGGKSPCYVDKAANVDACAKRIAYAKCMNAGQMCVAPDYAMVHSAVKDEFIAALDRAWCDMFGPDAKASPSFGRMVTERHVDRVVAMLGEEHGGKVVRGGLGAIDKAARFIEPTVVVDPKDSSRLLQEEIFAPVLVVKTVSGLDEAVATITARDTPLAAYCFTEDKAVADAFVARVPSGGAAINDLVLQLVSMECPFGGKGPSGMGAYRGRFSFDCFTHNKTVLTASTKMDPGKATRPPFDDSSLPMIEKMSIPPQWVKTAFSAAAKAVMAAMVAAAVAVFFKYFDVQVSRK